MLMKIRALMQDALRVSIDRILVKLYEACAAL